jgi:Mitochondrial ribosomal protein (VAR1)
MKIVNLKSNNLPVENKKVHFISEKKGNNKFTYANSKEWYNSIYNFKLEDVKHLPVIDNFIIKLIRSYFNMYSKMKQKKLGLRHHSKKKRKILGSKTWVSRAELKHTTDKVIINLYIYNRKNNFFLRKIKNHIKTSELFRKKKIWLFGQIKNKKNTTLGMLILVFYRKKIKSFLDKSNNLLLSNSFLKENIYLHLVKYYYTKLMKNIMKKEFIIMYYKQYILFNTLKYKNSYIVPLKKLIGKIYRKKVIFNIVSLKNYFFNSDILTQIIAAKAVNRKNKILKVLRAALRKVKTPILKKSIIAREDKKLELQKKILIKNKMELKSNFDETNIILKDLFEKQDTKSIEMDVISSLKNRTITGIRVEASGRLTKRFTAQRSIFKYKYKGTIKNIETSYKGLSSKNFRNNLDSSLQFTKLKSNNRIGAFGIKGWIRSN